MKRLAPQTILQASIALFSLVLVFLVFYLKPVSAKPSYSDFVLLENEIESFQAATQAEVIDLKLHQGAYVKEGLDSSHHLNFFSEERYNSKIEPGHYDCSQTSCDPLSILKDDIFKSYICGHIKALPFNFFNEAPYISNNGYSFVFRAYHSTHQEFASDSWLKTHSQYLSLPEITLSQSIRISLGLDSINIDSGLISEISERAKLVAYKNKIYIKEKTGALKYKSYKFSDLQNYLKDKALYSLANLQDEDCILKGRGFCFSRVIKPEFTAAQNLHTVLIVLLLALLSSLVLIVILKNKRSSKQSILRKLALDNLTHDFRTPVTNMVLMSKDLDNIFQNSPYNDQIKWLSFSSQVHKLHRATEDTKNYIQLLASNKVQKTKIKSVNLWLSSVCDEDVTLNLGSNDYSIEANTYWLHVCMKNLIKNAKDHGGDTVTVIVKESGQSYIELMVLDSGSGLHSSLTELTSEFSKGQLSSGLGLGLSIVSKAAELMGASLNYSHKPTTFSLKFKKGPAVHATDSYR